MPQADDLHSDALVGADRPDLGRSLMLLDRKQWTYLSRRYDLTPREVQIAELVCQGLRQGSIAGQLRIQPGTVKTHIRNIYRKVKVRNKMNMLLRFVAEAQGALDGREGRGP
jgi:DNA-binding NarL/FixJ family response regulator